MVKDRKCCVYKCKGNNVKRHLHRFPASEEIRRQWIDAIGDKHLNVLSIKKLKKKFVCSLHFERKYYSTEVENKLLSTAVPTLFKSDIKKTLDVTTSSNAKNEDNNRNNTEPTITIQNGMKTIVLRDSRCEEVTLVIPETFTISVRQCSPNEEDSDDWFGTSEEVQSDSMEWEGGALGIREILVDDLAPTKEAEESGRIKVVDPTREPIPVPSILDCLDLVPRNGTRCYAGTTTSEEVTVPCNTLLLEVGEDRRRTDGKEAVMDEDKDQTDGPTQRVKLNGINQSKSSRIMRWQPDVKLNVQCTVLLPKVEICVSCDAEYSNDVLHVCQSEKSNDGFKASLPRANCSAKATLIEHYSNKYSNAPSLFECELCTEIFESDESLTRHKKKEHEADVIVKSFKCVLCPQSFDECPKLTSHIEKSHIFQCDACNEIFVDEDGLHEHEVIDHGRPPNLVTHNKQSMNDFSINHFAKPNFVVKREQLIGRKPTLPHCCLESFKFQLSEQNKNVLKPSNVYMCHSCSKYMYKCAKCEHIFRTQHGMNIHFNKEHGVRFVKKVLPECCNVSFYKHLSSDSITASDITGKPIVCDACFENIYNCSVCREIFRTKYRVNKHMMKEHGETKIEKVKLLFKCSICLQTFSEQHLLDAHIKREHRFKCQTCCENFKTKFDLNKHIVSVHMSNCIIKQSYKKPPFLPSSRSPLKFERPFLSKANMVFKQKTGYQCFKCAKRCPSEVLLRQHIRDAHSTKRWECVTCRGVFQTEIALNDHIIDMHCSVPGNKVLRRCNVCKRMFENRWSIWGHVAMRECNQGRWILSSEYGGTAQTGSNQKDGSETNWAANMKIIKIEQIVDEDNSEDDVIEVDPLEIKEEVEDIDIGPEVLQYSDQRYSNCVEECAN